MSRNISKDKAILLTKLTKNPIVEIACKQSGVPRSTYYRWRKEDEGFADACDEAVAHSSDLINDLAESQLISAIKDKSMPAITFWLKHHHKSYKTKVEVSAVVEQPQQELTTEQAKAVNAALALMGLGVDHERVEP